MNQRIKKLREKSLEAIEHISAERALLITEFYKQAVSRFLPIPIQRAKSFAYILDKKSLYFDSDELIVGERGPYPKATPTYPEICLHSLEDLEILNSRTKVSFKVSKEVKEIYQNTIIPFWEGHSNRERIMREMTSEWKDAYQAGVFTEFQEQRAPGHTALGKKGFNTGFNQLIEEINITIHNIDHLEDPWSLAKHEELQAMKITAEAMIRYANRYADLLEKKAEEESIKTVKDHLLDLARICRNVPAQAPVTFHEALQHYWFIHLGIITEVNPWDSFNPGRLDQHLYSFYINDLKKGLITRERAVELLQAFWIKFNNHPAPPKVGITALESNTYTDFSLINLGGLTCNGSDGVNELTYIILDVIKEMRILQPSSMVQVSNKNPDKFIHRALEIVKTGFGQPSFFNTEAIIEELVAQGKDLFDARMGGASGCVESGAFGTEGYFLTGYFNLNKVLELTLFNGWDRRMKKQVGLKTGNPDLFSSFEKLMEAFKTQLDYFINIKIKGNCIIEQIFARYLPVPFLSLFIENCISRGTDYNAGGARYNSSYIQGVGLGSITDSLTAIKWHVFDKKSLVFSDLLNAIEDNFKNHEKIHHSLIYESPKYGNDEDYADEIAVRVFNLFYESVNGRLTPRGGKFRINMLPTTSHVYFGSVIGAMPDGRKASEPLSEGISPFQGVDKKGPTAVLKSASKIDHIKTGGTLLNQKFSPSFFDGEESIKKLTVLIRTYFRLKGHHIQFNVVSAETLKDAQKYPEKYRDLIVRVAGYSDYFNDLGEDLQNEIIRRTEQKSIG